MIKKRPCDKKSNKSHGEKTISKDSSKRVSTPSFKEIAEELKRREK